MFSVLLASSISANQHHHARNKTGRGTSVSIRPTSHNESQVERLPILARIIRSHAGNNAILASEIESQDPYESKLPSSWLRSILFYKSTNVRGPVGTVSKHTVWEAWK